MSEFDLRKRITELEVENFELLAENERLRKLLGFSQREHIPQGTFPVSNNLEQNNTKKTCIPLINKYSTPDEKIELFQSLFQGRTDVYAKRCYSKKHGSSYYVPACKNEWVKDLCDKTRIKCKDCPNRDLLPLTKEVINNHLRNKDEHGAGIIDIYPLLPNDNCLLLVVDFDEEKWKEDIDIFRSVCKTCNVPIAIERSRSGNGAQAWIFFEKSISALSARRMGNALLTKAMSVRPKICFTSYDRIILAMKLIVLFAMFVSVRCMRFR
ncbi:TOTE conflict system archaeo-eukaryotic primase domain-containing protein [Bacteroides sp. 224]|uniref:TOTE conflict system archaeo-eukaryotic primase domain-containing protein n=1 Tax=Bacteroides sp. 224 TaxID=2302936 RepID=UPI0013D79603|nr:hypothetical protein [Bacteroides sp. 224]NDV65295.1 hypothetical protein [Bacteroides sp. 224]